MGLRNLAHLAIVLAASASAQAECDSDKACEARIKMGMTLDASAEDGQDVSLLQTNAGHSKIAAKTKKTTRKVEHSLNATARVRDTCHKQTGGTCFGGTCDESRGGAQCESNLCVCPQLMCSEDGKCGLSADQVGSALQDAAKSGGSAVQSVKEQLTNLAVNVPGVADQMGGLGENLNGMFNTVSGVLGSWTGANDGGCSGYVSTCIFSDCDSVNGYAVSCQHGSCQCAQGMCVTNGRCLPDMKKFMNAVVPDSIR